jgi:L,D-peptidoglycan transpeptidase YkuD (ErfK/YbiS/YcfS/YnhG family)
MHIFVKNNYLIFNNYRIKCAVGKRGINNKKKEGDFITPKGLFKIKALMFRKDRIKNLKTSLKKITITKKMGWCDDSKSKKYNKLISIPFNYNYEKLFKKDNTYDIILVLDYNMNPIIKSKGSAIFIHISKKNYKKTEGCIAIKKVEFLKLLQKIKKNTKVKII